MASVDDVSDEIADILKMIRSTSCNSRARAARPEHRRPPPGPLRMTRSAIGMSGGDDRLNRIADPF